MTLFDLLLLLALSGFVAGVAVLLLYEGQEPYVVSKHQNRPWPARVGFYKDIDILVSDNPDNSASNAHLDMALVYYWNVKITSNTLFCIMSVNSELAPNREKWIFLWWQRPKANLNFTMASGKVILFKRVL